MTRAEACARRGEVIPHFAVSGEVVSCEPYGSGHINDTFCLVCRLENGTTRRYILQRINHEIFLKPKEVMENIAGVTAHLRKEIIRMGGDPERETLNIIPAKDGQPYYVDEGNYWRMFTFVENATGLDAITKPDDFYRSAVAFGKFQNQLADYPAATLHETIVNFHNTPARYETFERAVREDVCGRAASAAAEIAFVQARKADVSILTEQLAKGILPLRVTHNDTKLNNVLLDDKTGEGVCVIDLDTVMPGLAAYDFGDAIRFGASTGAEDERDLSKVTMSLELFELYAKGYIGASGGALTKAELASLAIGAKLMTLECGIRFLTDYLQNDIYFKIHRDGHNLDRCRTQFKLVADMEQKLDEMNRIVEKLA